MLRLCRPRNAASRHYVVHKSACGLDFQGRSGFGKVGIGYSYLQDVPRCLDTTSSVAPLAMHRKSCNRCNMSGKRACRRCCDYLSFAGSQSFFRVIAVAASTERWIHNKRCSPFCQYDPGWRVVARHVRREEGPARSFTVTG